MSFIGPGADLPTIYLPSEAAGIEVLAAHELQGLLQRMTGETLSLVSGERPRVPYIFLGTRDAFESYQDSSDGERPGELKSSEGFWMRMKEGRLDLVGGGPEGVLSAAYQFLECCGARWFEPGPQGALIPRCSQLDLSDAEQQSDPLFERRGLVNADSADAIDWMAKNRLNYLILEHGRFEESPSLFEQETAKRGIRLEILSHDLRRWVRPGDGVLDDPECRAQESDGRAGDGPTGPPRLCSSNEKVRKAVAEGLASFLEARPQVSGITLDLRHALRSCECRDCHRNRELDGREVPRVDGPTGQFQEKARTLSDGIWELFHALVARARELKPECRLRVFGTDESFHAPANARFRENEGCLLELSSRCYRHPLNATECLPNQCLWPALEKWTEQSRNEVVVYDRFDGPEEYLGMLFPAVRLLGTELLILHELGVSSVVTDGRWNRSTINAMNLWTFARQAWVGEGTVDSAFEDFFGRYYGSAARPIRDFFRVWHSRYLDIRGCFLGRGLDLLRLLGFHEFGEAQTHLESALSASEAEGPFQARVQREMAYFRLAGLVWGFLQSALRTASLRQAGLQDQAVAQDGLVEQRRAALLSYAATLDAGNHSAVEKVCRTWPIIINESLNPGSA